MSYLTETAKPDNQPAYIVRFVGLDTFQFASAPILSSSRTTHVCMELPSGTQQRLTDIHNRATYGEVRATIADLNGVVTALISQEKASPQIPTVVNRQLKLLCGYRNEAESEYVVRFTGELRDVMLVGPQLYEFTFIELKRRFEELLMLGVQTAETLKLASVPAIGQTFLIFTAEPKQVGQALLYKKDGSQYEKLTVVSLDTANKRANLSTGITQVWSDLNNDIYTTAPFMRGNIVNIYYALLTGTFERIYEPATSTPATTAFPLLDYWGPLAGLDIPAADIDTAGLLFTRDALYANFDADFLFRDQVRARTFFQQEMFLLGFFPYITAEGKVSIRAYVPPGPEVASPTTLKKQDSFRVPRWKRVIDSHYNRVLVRGDAPSLSASDYTLLATRENTTDQTNSGEIGLIEVNSGGLRTLLNGAALAQEVAARHLRRWQGPPVLIGYDASLIKRDLEIGKVVALTDPDLPDTTTGTVGLTDRLVEVTRSSVDFPEGVVRLELFDHSFGKRWSWIAPDGTPLYTSASPTDKRYAFFGNILNQVGGGSPVDGYYLY